MALVAHALITLQTAKDFIGGISGSADDSRLELFINMATEYIETYCDRRFKQTTYTDEVISGAGSNELVLRNWPVIGSVTLGKRNVVDNEESWDAVDADDFWIDEEGGTVTGVTVFRKGTDNYRVTYSGGYATIPYDLQYACASIVAQFWNRKQANGLKSESLGDHSVTFDVGAGGSNIPAEVEAILDKYRNIPIG
tara:strand:- start:229 stop:816 length:588 start_codon:yes stop_codon:yes gene_type:complete